MVQVSGRALRLLQEVRAVAENHLTKSLCRDGLLQLGSRLIAFDYHPVYKQAYSAWPNRNFLLRVYLRTDRASPLRILTRSWRGVYSYFRRGITTLMSSCYNHTALSSPALAYC